MEDAYFEWKDGELSYCTALVRSGGNHNVPRTFVREYLRMQQREAKRNLRDDVVEEFDKLLTEWDVILKGK